MVSFFLTLWALSSLYSQTALVQIECFNVSDPSQYCSTKGPTGANGCFTVNINGTLINAPCAQCNYPAAAASVNKLPNCTNVTGSNTPHSLNSSSYDFSASCSKTYTRCGCGGLSKPFKKTRRFVMDNKCDYPVWVGISGGAEDVHNINTYAMKGGFKLDANETMNLSIPNMEGFNLWGRTNCADVSGKFICDTGGCSAQNNSYGKNGKCCSDTVCIGPQSPESLVEFTLALHECSNDFYDVSLVDGYNIPISVEPIDFVLEEVLDYKHGDKYQCGIANISTFNAKSKCPNALLFDGTETRNKSSTDFNFSALSYCLSPCKALGVSSQVIKSRILQEWNSSIAYDVLIHNYSSSTLNKRYVDHTKPLRDLLCCDCGNPPKQDNNCYTATQCTFGCSSFITGGWNATATQPSGWAWKGNKNDYQKRECPNYGYKTYALGFDKEMPLWPLLNTPSSNDINPAYIYNDTSPDAYSWQFNDQSSSFQCRNADYKITFCHDQDQYVDDSDLPTTTSKPISTSNDNSDSVHRIELHVWFILVMLLQQ